MSRATQRRQSWRLPAIAALLAGVLTYGAAGPAISIETSPEAALIARARAALGPGLGRVKSQHVAGTCNAGDIHGPTEGWFDLTDGRFASKTDWGPLTAGYGYDGRTSWRSDSKGIVLPQTGPRAKALAANEIFDSTYALYSPGYGGASVSYLGTRSDAGQSYEAIAIRPKRGYAEEMWFDATTALPARRIVNYGAGPTTTSFSGYSSIGGLMIADEYKTTRQFVGRDSYGHEQFSTMDRGACKYDRVEVDADNLDKHLTMPAPPPNDVSLPGGETRIPFTMRNFWMTVDVRLNGKGPFQMMLDSGGSNVLSPSVAWQVGAQQTGEVPVTGNIAMLKPVRYVRVDSVELGGATLKQQDFAVGGVGNIFTRDGMIGFEVFERFVTTIDYVNRQIILRLPGDSHGPAPSLAAAEASIPLVFDDTKPGTACTIAGTDATCIADTGAAIPLVLSGPFTKAHSSIQPPWYAGAYGGVNAGGSGSEVRLGPVSSLQIGPFVLKDINTVFTTAANGTLAIYPSALVGNPILQQFTVTFGYSRAAMRLTPNSSFKHQ